MPVLPVCGATRLARPAHAPAPGPRATACLRSSVSSTRTASACGAFSSPRWGPPRPTTASRRRSSPPCAPTRACAPAPTCARGCSPSPTTRRWTPTARARAERCPSRTWPPWTGAPRASPQAPDDGLWDAVRELPERQRSAVTLRYVGDLPHREIAQAIGCSEEAARRSLHEGLTKLRKVVSV